MSKHFKHLKYLFILIFLSFVQIVFAQDARVQDQFQIPAQQNQHLDYFQNDLQIRQALKIRDAHDLETQKSLLPPLFTIDTGDKNNIASFEKFIIKGNKIFADRILFKHVLSKFLNKPINKNNLKLLQTELMNFYLKKGYTMARVYFDTENINEISKNFANQQGIVFVVIIEEGKVDNIILEKETLKEPKKLLGFFAKFRQSLQIFFAFPFKKNKVFKLKDFEQGLDQMNRLASNNANMAVKPAQDKNVKEGYSDIVIINNQNPKANGVPTGRRTIFPNISYSNSGANSTGKEVLSIAVSADNMLSIDDNFYISYTNSAKDFFMPDEMKSKYSKSFYSGFSFPFGYQTFNIFVNASEYKTTVEGNFVDIVTKGETLTQNYSLENVLYRTQKIKSSLGLNLQVKDNETYINGIASKVGTRQTSAASVYFNNIIYTPISTMIIKPSYQRGVSWFGSERDSKLYEGYKILETDPKTEYALFKLYIYQRYEVLKFLSYSLTTDMQYSQNALYAQDQMSIGGLWSVRGFSENSISGDNGIYFRNDLTLNLFAIMPVGIRDNLKVKKILSKTFIGIFYDYGYVEDKYADPFVMEYKGQSGRMSGAGVFLRYEHQYLQMSLTYAKALESPRYLYEYENLKEESESVYWNMTVSW